MYKQCYYFLVKYKCFVLDEVKRVKNNIYMQRFIDNDFILDEYNFNKVYRVN